MPTESCRVLIVEDESLVALDLADALGSAGFVPVGPVGTVSEALSAVASECIDAALLDAKLCGEWADPVAEALTRRAIPFALITGYRLEDLRFAAHSQAQISKPFMVSEVMATLQTLLPKCGRRL